MRKEIIYEIIKHLCTCIVAIAGALCLESCNITQNLAKGDGSSITTGQEVVIKNDSIHVNSNVQ